MVCYRYITHDGRKDTVQIRPSTVERPLFDSKYRLSVLLWWYELNTTGGFYYLARGVPTTHDGTDRVQVDLFDVQSTVIGT